MIESVKIPCPFLPHINGSLPVHHTRDSKMECGPKFYQCCLELAQSQWLAGKPAQAILQCDKAMMAQLPAEPQLAIPYEAILWIIEHSHEEQFLGDPVRHFQHLASRMNYKQAQPELRIARAWACLHLTELRFPMLDFSRDYRQIEREKLVIPNSEEILKRIKSLSPHLSEYTYLKTQFTRQQQDT